MKRLWIAGGALVLSSCAHQVAEVRPKASRPRLYRNTGLPVVRPVSMQPAMEQQVRNAVYAGEGDLEAREFRRRITSNPQDLDARLGMARHYRKMGFGELAVEHLRLAAERFPDSAGVALELAESLAGQEMLAEAASGLQAFLAKDANNRAELPSLLGILRDELEEYAAGESAHRAALAISPTNPKLHNNLGYNLWLQGKREDAVAAFRRALSLDSHFAVARNNLGRALLESPAEQDRREAVGHFEAAADRAVAHNNAAAVLMEQGRYDEARKELEQALAVRPDFAPALRNLALLTERDGKPLQLPQTGQARESRRSRVWRAILGIEKKPEPAGVTLAKRK
ncbi:MAG: tetratricopeptide repeat protein [Bryobacterales bacterium]|nr:tetratricopeptide repeat protein [Bryobacterales bacterium]